MTEAATQKKHIKGQLTIRDIESNSMEICGIVPSDPNYTNHVEVTLRSDKPIPLFVAVWTQFAPAEWDNMQRDNAERMVACWNAFVGVPTEDIKPKPETEPFRAADDPQHS